MATISRRTKKASAVLPAAHVPKAKVAVFHQRGVEPIGAQPSVGASAKASLASSVDHPPHYNVGKIEVIDFIEDQRLGFHLGNAVKYIARSAYKGREVEDLKKAAWYLDRMIIRLQLTKETHETE